MNRFYLVILLLLFALPVFSQIDSSLIARERLNRGATYADSLQSYTTRLDSINSEVDRRMDSVRTTYTNALSPIEHTIEKLQSKVDSLQERTLPADHYTDKIDSLMTRARAIEGTMEARIAAIKNKAGAEIQNVGFPPEMEKAVSALTARVEKLNISTLRAKLPASFKFDKLSSNLALPELSNAGLPSIPNVNGVPGVPNLPAVDGVSSITNKASELQGTTGAIAAQKPESLDALAESNITKLKAVEELQKESALLPTDQLASESAMKEKLISEARNVAVDHFAGKQQELQAAMDKMSKVKKKYAEVINTKDLPRRPPNAMRGKPLIDRLIPGIGLQFQKKADVFMVDFNPFMGYRFTGRINAGLGWNQRVGYSFHARTFSPSSRIYGPRAFGEYSLEKGFSPRIEIETMNTRIPPSTLAPNHDPNHREWVFGAFTGIKKEYKFLRKVKGTAIVMVRLYDPHRKSPYGDIINVRLGFEMPLYKRVKSTTRK